jgi:uncharacterized protein YjbI with pentapeptide repeats
MRILPCLTTFFLALSTSLALGDIYQHFDGDNDGSLFLSNIIVEPGADLSGMTLYWADLSGADLTAALLTGTNLFGANLSNATLTSAYMHQVNFEIANLQSADLSYAYMLEAGLSGADLSYAQLDFAYLVFADLSDAILSYADLSYANLIGADLTGADLGQVEQFAFACFHTATYDADTTFAEGMDPDALGMIFVPAPGALFLLGIGVLAGPRRRRA